MNKKVEMKKLVYTKSGKAEISIFNKDTNVIFFKSVSDNEHHYNYDENGNLTGYICSDGNSLTKEYDEQGRIVHLVESHRDSENKFEKWFTYNGNSVSAKDSDGGFFETVYSDTGKILSYKDPYIEEIYEYNEKDQLIHYKNNSEGSEYWKEYNEKGLETKFTRINGLEVLTEYDEKGNRIHVSTKDVEEWYEYNEKSQVIHYKNSKGHEYWREYTEDGKISKIIDNHKHEKIYEYDENGYLCKVSDDGKISLWKYDKDGNELYYKNHLGFESHQEYNENGDRISYTDNTGANDYTITYKYYEE